MRRTIDPKQVWLRELVEKSLRQIAGGPTAAGVGRGGSPRTPRCQAKAKEIASLREHLAPVPEFRRKQALGYPLAGMLALIAMAMFSGVVRGPKIWRNTRRRSRKASCGR